VPPVAPSASRPSCRKAANGGRAYGVELTRRSRTGPRPSRPGGGGGGGAAERICPATERVRPAVAKWIGPFGIVDGGKRVAFHNRLRTRPGLHGRLDPPSRHRRPQQRDRLLVLRVRQCQNQRLPLAERDEQLGVKPFPLPSQLFLDGGGHRIHPGRTPVGGRLRRGDQQLLIPHDERKLPLCEKPLQGRTKRDVLKLPGNEGIVFHSGCGQRVPVGLDPDVVIILPEVQKVSEGDFACVDLRGRSQRDANLLLRRFLFAFLHLFFRNDSEAPQHLGQAFVCRVILPHDEAFRPVSERRHDHAFPARRSPTRPGHRLSDRLGQRVGVDRPQIIDRVDPRVPLRLGVLRYGNQKHLVQDHIGQVQFTEYQAQGRTERDVAQVARYRVVRVDADVVQAPLVDLDFDVVAVPEIFGHVRKRRFNKVEPGDGIQSFENLPFGRP